METEKSGQETVVETVLLVLLEAFGSVGEETDATFVTESPQLAEAVENLRVNFFDEPVESLAVEGHMTAVPSELQPEAESNIRPEGMIFLRVYDWLAEGPLFVILIL